jgi:hypothetical protein
MHAPVELRVLLLAAHGLRLVPKVIPRDAGDHETI